MSTGILMHVTDEAAAEQFIAAANAFRMQKMGMVGCVLENDPVLKTNVF